MTRRVCAIFLSLAAVVGGCGGAADRTAPVSPSTTVTTDPLGEACVRPPAGEALVTRLTSGFAPHATLVVRTNGFAWGSAGPGFGGPRCYALPTELLAELRAALEAADLSSLASSYSGSTQGPEGQVIEIVTYTVTASDVTVSADSSADVPDSLERLNDVLGRAEGAVIENG